MSSAHWNFPGEDCPPPESVLVASQMVKAGDRIRLRPGRWRVNSHGSLADAIDIMLEGKVARIEAIQQDFENRIYLVVTLDDDPGQEQWDERILPGHRFFFFPEEVELLEEIVVNLPSPRQEKIRHILIACIGNIFMGDDGFGVEVAQRLLNRKVSPFPENIQIIDFGIRGLDLAYALLDDYDTLVLVDAVPRGASPGTLYLIEPDLAAMTCEKGVESIRMGLDAHSMDPVKVLAYARTLGAQPIRTLLVGCEPSAISGNEDDRNLQMGLSKPVQAAIDEAVKMIDSLVEELLAVNL